MTSSEYNECVKRQADGLYRFALKSLKDEEHAKDVVQQAFLILWEKRREVVEGKAKSYLFTIAYRRCMDVWRHKRKFIEPEVLENTVVAESATAPDLKAILNEALSKLSHQNRMLVLLKDYEGYSYEEISELTGLSQTQVKVYLHRSRKELRAFLVSKNHLI